MVHGRRVGVLDPLHVGERDAAQRYRSPARDAPVERRARSERQRKLPFRKARQREARAGLSRAPDLTRAAQRLCAKRERGVREQLRRRGSRLGLGLRLRGAHWPRVAFDVEQAAHELCAADAVDGGVMDLGHHREARALEPLDHPDLPERAVAVERHLRDPRDRVEQLAIASRDRQRHAVQVVVERERAVVRPRRSAQAERRREQPAAQDRQRRQPAFDLRADAPKMFARTAPARFQHERAHHVQRRLCRLGRQERRIHSAESPPAHESYGPPMNSRGS